MISYHEKRRREEGKMTKLAALTKQIKQYSYNRHESDEKFLNDFLHPYIKAGKIKNRLNEEFYLNKTRTSAVMNGKEDIPRVLRDELRRYGIREKTISWMTGFVKDHINPTLQPQLLSDLSGSINADPMLSEQDKVILLQMQNDLPALLTDLLIRSLSESNLIDRERTILWENGTNVAEIITGDLFRYGFDNRRKSEKNIVVIPVNTSFDTHVTRRLEGKASPIVSVKTIHGQWLNRMEQSGENLMDLDERIAASLESLGYKPACIETSRKRNMKTYDIGAISVIETENTLYFLLAISEFDESNRAQSTPDKIKTSICSLLRLYDRIGQGYDLYMPLMGSGRSRTGMSIREAYKLLTDAIIENRSFIQGHLHLVVRPEDMKKIKEF